MKKNLKLLVGIVVILGLTFQFTQANAQIENQELPNREGYRFGEILLHTFLAGGVDFESNIFLADQNESFDVIGYLIPSVGVGIPFSDNLFSTEYTATINEFDRFSDQGHIDQKIQSLLEINLTDFKVILANIYNFYTNRAGADETGSSGSRTKEIKNNFDFIVEAEFDKLGYKLSYSNNYRRYPEKSIVLFTSGGTTLFYKDKNYMQHVFSGIFNYRVKPKTTLILETSGGWYNYHSTLTPDFCFIEILQGIKGEWINNLTFNIRGGPRYQEYDRSGFVLDDGYLGGVGKANIEYKLTEDDVSGLTAERSYHEAIYQNLNHRDVTFAALDYTHRFTDKIAANTYYSWQISSYPRETAEGGVTARRQDREHKANRCLS